MVGAEFAEARGVYQQLYVGGFLLEKLGEAFEAALLQEIQPDGTDWDGTPLVQCYQSFLPPGDGPNHDYDHIQG